MMLKYRSKRQIIVFIKAFIQELVMNDIDMFYIYGHKLIILGYNDTF